MTLVVTFFHFRQLRPSNRIAHRDAMTNKCNMKKLQINAQVTAMTTLIEHIGNVTSLVVTIHFTTNLSWFLSRLTLEILFYCIMVPHSLCFVQGYIYISSMLCQEHFVCSFCLKQLNKVIRILKADVRYMYPSSNYSTCF